MKNINQIYEETYNSALEKIAFGPAFQRVGKKLRPASKSAKTDQIADMFDKGNKVITDLSDEIHFGSGMLPKPGPITNTKFKIKDVLKKQDQPTKVLKAINKGRSYGDYFRNPYTAERGRQSLESMRRAKL